MAKAKVSQNEWLSEIGHKFNGKNLPGKFLFVTLQPLLVYDKDDDWFKVVPSEKIVSRRLVRWYKEQMETYADHHKIKLISVWAQGTRICMMFDQTKPTWAMEIFKEHVENPDDDGNAPVKIFKRVFMVSATDCHVYA